MLSAQIQAYEHHCLLFTRWQQGKKEGKACPEDAPTPGARHEWSVNKFFGAEIQTMMSSIISTDYIRTFAWEVLKVAHKVGDADISKKSIFTVPILPRGLADWTPKAFVKQTKIRLTLTQVL
jgi:hypothetical protein